MTGYAVKTNITYLGELIPYVDTKEGRNIRLNKVLDANGVALGSTTYIEALEIAEARGSINIYGVYYVDASTLDAIVAKLDNVNTDFIDWAKSELFTAPVASTNGESLSLSLRLEEKAPTLFVRGDQGTLPQLEKHAQDLAHGRAKRKARRDAIANGEAPEGYVVADSHYCNMSEQFFKLPNGFLSTLVAFDLSTTEMVIYLFFVSITNNRSATVQVSYDTLVANTGATRSTVNTALKSLNKLGLVTSNKGGQGKRSAGVYNVYFPYVEAHTSLLKA